MAQSSTNLLDKAADWGFELFTAIFIMVAGWVAKWKWDTDKAIRALELNVSENYVKKTDMVNLKAEIAAEFQEVKDSQAQILDVLLSRKIGTTGRRR